MVALSTCVHKMLLKFSFLLLCHAVNGSMTNLSPSLSDIMDISKASAELVREICTYSSTLNIIQINQTQVAEEMIKLLSKNIEMAIQVEEIESLNYPPRARRSCNVFVISSLSDFDRMHSILSPHRFNYLKHFLIVSLRHHLPSQIEQIFVLFWKKFILDARIVQPELEKISVTTFYPFKAHSCNDTKPVVVNYFVNGRFTSKIKHFRKLNDLKKCPLRVVTASKSEPFTFVKREGNKVVLKGNFISFFNFNEEK